MAELFSDDWINQLKDHWNQTPEVKEKLEAIEFSSIITCGFKGESEPRCVFKVEKGHAISAGLWNGEESHWDMRADYNDWIKWINKPLGMAGMGLALTTGRLQFRTGDYASMIKDPRMAGPFIKSFALMNRIGAS